MKPADSEWMENEQERLHVEEGPSQALDLQKTQHRQPLTFKIILGAQVEFLNCRTGNIKTVSINNMEVDAHDTCSALLEDQSITSRVPNPSGPSLLQKHASAESYSSREGQEKYAAMMAEMEEMSKALDKINADLRKASVKCYTLIVDVATLFNPETEEMARNVVEDCELCKNRVKAMLANEDLLS